MTDLDYQNYIELTSEYMQTKQRLMALVDWNRITQIRLEKYYVKTKDETLLDQIDTIKNNRETLINVCRKDLDSIIDQMVNSNYQKRFLK